MPCRILGHLRKRGFVVLFERIGGSFAKFFRFSWQKAPNTVRAWRDEHQAAIVSSTIVCINRHDFGFPARIYRLPSIVHGERETIMMTRGFLRSLAACWQNNNRRSMKFKDVGSSTTTSGFVLYSVSTRSCWRLRPVLQYHHALAALFVGSKCLVSIVAVMTPNVSEYHAYSLACLPGWYDHTTAIVVCTSWSRGGDQEDQRCILMTKMNQ